MATKTHAWLFSPLRSLQLYVRNYFFYYLNFSFDEGGDVVLVLKDGEGLQQVVLQPLPVLRDLLARASWRGESGRSQSAATEKGIYGNTRQQSKMFLRTNRLL